MVDLLCLNMGICSECPTPRRQTGGQNFALCPALSNRKSPWGKDPNVKTPSFPLQCGDTQKVIALHFRPAIPTLPLGRGGGGGGGGSGYK